MIELSRAQDEEVGDGTTSVIILAGEVLGAVESFLERDIHPTVIVNAYFKGLDDIVELTKTIGKPIDMESNEDLRKIVQSSIGTKFASKWGNLIVDLAVQAVRTVYRKEGSNIEIDTKRYAKVEKIPGGLLEDCKVLDGVMFNKDVCHPGMRREIRNPRVVLLDCPLEYKKGESMTNMEFTKEDDFKKALAMEEIEVRRMCEHILKMKPAKIHPSSPGNARPLRRLSIETTRSRYAQNQGRSCRCSRSNRLSQQSTTSSRTALAQ